jgi:hypothetical protein
MNSLKRATIDGQGQRDFLGMDKYHLVRARDDLRQTPGSMKEANGV